MDSNFYEGSTGGMGIGEQKENISLPPINTKNSSIILNSGSKANLMVKRGNSYN
jgi:hypothetical protein